MDSASVPQNPTGDAVVGCFSNCGRYGFPLAPTCKTSDSNCYYWQTFCLGLPNGAYNATCKTDNDCYFKGKNYGIACFKNTSVGPSAPTGKCAGRAFLKDPPCSSSVCTFPYGYAGSYAWQPPFGKCSDITSDPSACIGDDTIHAVLWKAYTWPNDPQVYDGDAPVYRIVFAPGGNPASAPITPSFGQGINGLPESGIPLCSSLNSYYGYASQYSGPGPNPEFCTKPCDGQLNPSCPSFKSPAAAFAVAYPGASAAQPWACNFNPAGGGGNNGVICRWQ